MSAYFPLLFILLSLYPSVHSKLLFTIWFVRHGAKEPQEPLNEVFEPFNKSFLGHRILTNVGTRQQYILGRIFYDMYKNKFDINPGSLVFRSTVYSRTFESALSFIRGFADPPYCPIEKYNSQQPSFRPSLPIFTDEETTNEFFNTYHKFGSTTQYTIYHDLHINDPLTYSRRQIVCPGIGHLYRELKQTPKYQHKKAQAKEIVADVLDRVYKPQDENDKRTLKGKIQTLRYGRYFKYIPKNYLTSDESFALDKARRLLQLNKGIRSDTVTKMGCHNLFRQFIELFDYAITLNKLGAEDFQKVGMHHHKALAKRDPAYIPRYRWLKNNPELVGKMRGMLFANHDGLLFLVLRAMTGLPNEEIITPFASNIQMELHEEQKEKYYVKVRFNGKHLPLPLCNSEKCPLEMFRKVLKKGGMMQSEQAYYEFCYSYRGAQKIIIINMR
eukprot:TRINITY_DN4435_c0_g1_i1.p1 TRINITY_DN4435_c0_g1~~TRINITY_DN4435_c0_g1_i1.p1  ORF type:complete len:443 (-),score=25.13 TRINITY_DN4435_c0_g1_i1:90-1418(-)